MRNTIINKFTVLLILSVVIFTSCKNEKVCDLYDLVQRVYAGEDVSIIDNVIDYEINTNSKLNNKIVCGGGDISSDINTNPFEMLWFFINEDDYEQGMIIVLVHIYTKKKGKTRTQNFYLKDYAFIPGFSKNRIAYQNVSYGESEYGRSYIQHYNKNGSIEREFVGDTSIRYNIDENIYGIYAYEGKYPPYNKKVKPKYLVYVENNKLVVEKPKDDKYFIYRIPEL